MNVLEVQGLTKRYPAFTAEWGVVRCAAGRGDGVYRP